MFVSSTFRFLIVVAETARALKSRMTPLSWVLLARNVPFKQFSSSVSSSPTSPSGSGVVAGAGAGESEAAKAAPSLRHQVCHRLLTERFLSNTSYLDAAESPEGLGRALKALQVLLDDEDDLLEVSVIGLRTSPCLLRSACRVIGQCVCPVSFIFC